MKTIYEFKSGDEVVRIQPSKPIQNIFGSGVQDRSYPGEKFILKTVANGVIYLKRENERKISMFGENLELTLDIWEDGWDYWSNIESDEYEEKPASDYIHKKMLEAADKEDYELAEKMKEMYNRLKDIENNFKK